MNKRGLLITATCCITAFVIGYLVCLNEKTQFLFLPRNSSDLASWIGAFGSVGAVIAAIWIMDRQHSLSEQSLLAERAHSSAKEAQERRDRLAICLMVALHTALGIRSVLDALESAEDNKVALTLSAQIGFIAITAEPTLRIPMHELGTVEAVQRVFAVANLAQRLGESLAAWSRQEATSLPYISDMRKTVALLKPEASDVLSAIEQSFVSSMDS